MKFDALPLRVIPLGGIQEIGKNMTLLEYGDDIMIIDCGVAFPDDQMPGVDLVIPDISYLEANRSKVRGMVLTHGHEDHIGALPYVLPGFDIPVYGTRLTLGLVEEKLSEARFPITAELVPMEPEDVCRIGCFSVEFIRVNHSIQGAVALAIHTPVGIVFHTGDFKVDYTPVDDQPIDLARIAELGNQGVLLYMADSTNVEREGFTLSERSVGANLEEYIRTAPGRVIVTTFSSNIHRIQQIIDIAARYDRKVCFSGRSMLRVTEVAMDLGELNVDTDRIVDVTECKNMSDKSLMVLTTGSQGEAMSGLMRMANQMHPQLNIKEGDTVILSSSSVPGNEKQVYHLIDQLYRCGAYVVYGALADVHVSGHACKEELKLMCSLVHAQFFMPVHGEFRHLKQHADLAQKLGMDAEDTIIAQNGHVYEFTPHEWRDVDAVPAGGVMVDGFGIGDVGTVVLRDRRHLSQDGLMVVVLTMDPRYGTLLAGPEVITRGFVYVRDSDELLEEVKSTARDVIEKYGIGTRPGDWSALKAQLRTVLNRFLYEKTKRSPMILPVIMEVEL